jgi:integrase
MATARKLPSGAWRVQASRKVNGVLEKKSFTSSDKRTAEAEAAAWQADKQNESIEKITLRQAYERYIASKENILSPGTIREYYGTARRHLQDIMDIRISKLTTEQIQRSINICAASTSPKTVRNVHGLLSSVLRMFRPQFILNTTLPQKKPAELYIPDDNDIKKLMQAVKGTEMEIPVLLAAFGPMRRGEICALNSDDVNGNFVTVNKAVVTDKNGKTVVKVPKTASSYRTIEYPDFVIEKLKDIKGPITNISPGHITRRFKRILANNGIPHFRFHDLRHYNVSILHAMNIPDKYIMARGGWRTNYTMNNVYNHALKSKQTEYDNKISNHFKNIYD